MSTCGSCVPRMTAPRTAAGTRGKDEVARADTSVRSGSCRGLPMADAEWKLASSTAGETWYGHPGPGITCILHRSTSAAREAGVARPAVLKHCSLAATCDVHAVSAQCAERSMCRRRCPTIATTLIELRVLRDTLPCSEYAGAPTATVPRWATWHSTIAASRSGSGAANTTAPTPTSCCIDATSRAEEARPISTCAAPGSIARPDTAWSCISTSIGDSFTAASVRASGSELTVHTTIWRTIGCASGANQRYCFSQTRYAMPSLIT